MAVRYALSSRVNAAVGPKIKYKAFDRAPKNLAGLNASLRLYTEAGGSAISTDVWALDSTGLLDLHRTNVAAVAAGRYRFNLDLVPASGPRVEFVFGIWTVEPESSGTVQGSPVTLEVLDGADGVEFVEVTSTVSTEGGSGTTDHAVLTNRSAADQHPISAVSGLQAALYAKATNDALTALSDAITAALATYQLLSAKGAASGYAGLSASAKLLEANLLGMALTGTPGHVLTNVGGVTAMAAPSGGSGSGFVPGETGPRFTFTASGQESAEIDSVGGDFKHMLTLLRNGAANFKVSEYNGYTVLAAREAFYYHIGNYSAGAYPNTPFGVSINWAYTPRLAMGGWFYDYAESIAKRPAPVDGDPNRSEIELTFVRDSERKAVALANCQGPFLTWRNSSGQLFEYLGSPAVPREPPDVSGLLSVAMLWPSTAYKNPTGTELALPGGTAARIGPWSQSTLANRPQLSSNGRMVAMTSNQRRLDSGTLTMAGTALTIALLLRRRNGTWGIVMECVGVGAAGTWTLQTNNTADFLFATFGLGGLPFIQFASPIDDYTAFVVRIESGQPTDYWVNETKTTIAASAGSFIDAATTISYRAGETLSASVETIGFITRTPLTNTYIETYLIPYLLSQAVQ